MANNFRDTFLPHTVVSTPTIDTFYYFYSAQKLAIVLPKFTVSLRVEGWVDLGGWVYVKMVQLSADSNPLSRTVVAVIKYR